MPSAFVLMPFAQEFDPVYEYFIRRVLEDAGFDVARADEIKGQNNIIRNVVEGIAHNDLIVADLTGANANVFYELGIAHTRDKPVILIAQSVEHVPFDLKSYRVLEYAAEFPAIEEAKKSLSQLVRDFLEGTATFDNPITDFLQDKQRLNKDIEPILSDISREDERGFLDHLIDLINGYNSIAGIAEGITKDLHILTSATKVSTEEFNQIGANRNASSPAAARRVARKLAEQVARFKNRLKIANTEYASIAQNTEDSLEIVLGFQPLQSEAPDQKIAEHLTYLRQLQNSVEQGRDGLLDMAGTMDDLPKIERRLNRELREGSAEILEMAGTLDKTIASISRALEKYA